MKIGFHKLLIINNIQIIIFPLKPKGVPLKPTTRFFKTNGPLVLKKRTILKQKE